MNAKEARRRGFVRKKCAKCGEVGYAPSARRFCHRPNFGRNSYACWGRLERVNRKRAQGVPLQPGMGLGWYLTEEAQTMIDAKKKRPQDVAAKKLEHARKMVSEKTAALRRLTTSLHMWEQRATRYARDASMTDAEVAAQRAAEQQRKERRTRGRVRAIAAAGGLS